MAVGVLDIRVRLHDRSSWRLRLVNTLVAQPFDVARLVTTAEPVPIAENVPTFITPSRAALFAVPQAGLLAVRPGVVNKLMLVWRDRQGKEVGTAAEVAFKSGSAQATAKLALSP